MKPWLKWGSALLALPVIVVALQIAASESGEVVVIATRDAAGDARETRLWVVDHDGSAWLRAGSVDSGWYQRLAADPRLHVRRGDVSYSATAQPGADDKGAVNDLMNAKYGWADDFIALLYGRGGAVPIRLVESPQPD